MTNASSWLALLGHEQMVTVTTTHQNIKRKHSHLTDEDKVMDWQHKNPYAHGEEFANNIKELMKDLALKSDDMYDILLKKNEIPVTKFKSLMSRRQFYNYVRALRKEIGQGKRPYSDKAKIKRMMDSGETNYWVISNKLNIPVKYVQFVMREYSIEIETPYINRRKQSFNEKVSTMIKMYVEDKKTIVEIGKIVGLASSTVFRYLRSNGVKMGERSRNGVMSGTYIPKNKRNSLGQFISTVGEDNG